MRTPPPVEWPDGATPLFRVLYGSFAHGTETPTSDEDWRGTYLLPSDAFLGLSRPKTTHEAPPDQVYWELGHFCSLLVKGNPNIVGMLWAPAECYDWDWYAPAQGLFENRTKFIHRNTVAAYLGWVNRELRDIAKAIERDGKIFTKIAKRLSHVPRLLWEVEGAVLNDDLVVHLSGDRLATVMAIKTNTLPLPEAMALCGTILLDVEHAIEGKPLRDPPTDWTEQWLLDARGMYG